MNIVALSGRLVRDPEVRYTSDQMCVATFTLAVDRHDKEKHTDFPRITVFGKQAENVEKYCKRGKPVEVYGEIRTGSYKNSRGETVYTTDVTAGRVQFLPEPKHTEPEQPRPEATQPAQMDFASIDEDVPF